MFRYRMPDGVTGTDFQTKDLDRECEFYEISSDRRLLRWQENGELKDTLFEVCYPPSFITVLLTLMEGCVHYIYQRYYL